MKSLAVRPAGASDAAEAARISRRPFAAAWSERAYAEEAGRGGSIFLVAEDARVRGYVIARVLADEARLLDLAAEEDGRGIGRALWEALVAAARRFGVRALTFEVSAANARALDFYRRRGARVVGCRAKFYNDGSDAILMDLSLA